MRAEGPAPSQRTRAPAGTTSRRPTAHPEKERAARRPPEDLVVRDHALGIILFGPGFAGLGCFCPEPWYASRSAAED
jgi:hypothetical protein